MLYSNYFNLDDEPDGNNIFSIGTVVDTSERRSSTASRLCDFECKAILSTRTKMMLLFLVLSKSFDSANLRQSKEIDGANKSELKGS